MPELPEVETIRRQLENEVMGRKIAEVKFDPENGNTLRFRQKKDLESILPGKKIMKARRRGKYLFLSLENDYHLMLHLKMTGRLLLKQRADKQDEFHRFLIELDDGRQLRFSDRSGFADLYLWDNSDLVDLDKKLGQEPEKITKEDFMNALSKSKVSNVKEALLDQGTIAGVGNINADEALFVAKIHPKQDPKTLSEEQAGILLDAIRSVLDKDLKNGGSTIDSYLDLYGNPGKNQESFYVYGRIGQPCKNCSTPIEYMEISGRRTHFCPSCQTLQQLTLF
jgi:formamidopyrimidine-DNA glycosylase